MVSPLNIVAISISAVALILTVHTKYKQRHKKKFKQLSGELDELVDITKDILQIYNDPRSHEDIDISVDQLIREVIKTHHDTEGEQVQIIPKITTGTGDNKKEIDDVEKALDMYKSGDFFSIYLTIGSREDMYVSSREINFIPPYDGVRFFYDSLNEIQTEYSNVINEFDENLLENMEITVDEIAESALKVLLNEMQPIEVNVDQYESEELGEYLLDKMFYYDGVDQDLQQLENQVEDLEELRQLVLQTSYT